MEMLLLKRRKGKVVLDNEEATVREKVEKEVVVESDLDAEVEDGVDLDEDLRVEVQSRKDLKNNLLENLLLSKEKGVTGNSVPSRFHPRDRMDSLGNLSPKTKPVALESKTTTATHYLTNLSNRNNISFLFLKFCISIITRTSIPNTISFWHSLNRD